jgi:hypothetical protein
MLAGAKVLKKRYSHINQNNFLQSFYYKKMCNFAVNLKMRIIQYNKLNIKKLWQKKNL